jgi:hypothetical protein
MIIALSIIGLILLILIAGKIKLSIRFKNQVAILKNDSSASIDKIYSQEEITQLPEPVQRYFNYALKNGQPYIYRIHFKHGGQFKTGVSKNWVNITGEQFVTTNKPGFIWKGRTSMFTAFDLYIKDKGRLSVFLFSFIKILDGKDEHYDEGELLRWLGESVFYPTNLLPSERLQWSAIDRNSARLSFQYKNFSLFFIARINDRGEIIQLETKRYMDKNHLETWMIKLSDYKEINNVRIPTTSEAIWKLEKADFSYARFLIKEIEYNK